MADIKWIKLSADIFNNRKIKQIEAMPEGDALIVIWIKLLVLASEVNDGGCIYFTRDIPYTDQLLSTQFGRPLATIQLALRTFSAFNMIEIVDDIICVSNWERYQNIEGMEKIREQNRIRQQNRRAKLASESRDSHVTVTQCHATDKIRKEEEENRESEGQNAARFTPPTVEEVRAYCQERGNKIDAEYFVNHYESNGWMVGRNKMKDWKAAIRAWETNGIDKKDSQPAPSYDLDGIMRSAMDFDPTKTNRGEV